MHLPIDLCESLSTICTALVILVASSDLPFLLDHHRLYSLLKAKIRLNFSL
ncbi:hypothetical protein OIU77_031172 [Salix suchowensis]|uniref:Uncharacterized protein n=1 Tax=Salix suchowensis TaxID=1278906 RepID=A0ABQ9BEJ0_9ROSI|nr:hypothetical protein OIU77_031172 [Salix suchowensis]